MPGHNLTIGERPYYLFFGRDPNVGVQALLDKSPSVAGDEVYQIQRYAYQLASSVLQKENLRRDKKMLSSGRLTSYNEGDIVYIQRHFVNEKAHKIRYPYTGPYRVTSVQGNTVELNELATNKVKRALMRQLKLYKAGSLSKTCHPNVGRIFPLEDEIELDTESRISGGVTEGQLEVRDASTAPPAAQSPPKYNLRSRRPK